MEVTYTLNSTDMMWQTARGWLNARPDFKRRLAMGILIFACLPFILAFLFPSLTHAIEAFWFLDLIVGGALLVAAWALIQKFVAPLFAMAVDGETRTISIGPDCVVEQNVEVIAIPWEYVRTVRQDLMSTEIVVDNNDRYTIPRRAFSSIFASAKFGYLAHSWWRKAVKSTLKAPHAPPRQIS